MKTQAIEYLKAHKRDFIDSYIKNLKSQTTKIALFTAGCSGAGKTEYSSYRITNDQTLLHIDTDHVRSFFVPIGYNGANAEIFQHASSKGVDILVDASLKKQVSIILDTNFCNFEKQKSNIERCLNKDYEVTIVYILVELSQAYSQVLAREKVTQRHVPEKKIPETLIESIKTTSQIKAYFGSNITLKVIDRRYGLEKEYNSIDEKKFEALVHLESKKAQNALLRHSSEESLQLNIHKNIDFLQAYTLKKAYELISVEKFNVEYLSGMNRINQIASAFQDLTKTIDINSIIPLPNVDYLDNILNISTSFTKTLETYTQITNPISNIIKLLNVTNILPPESAFNHFQSIVDDNSNNSFLDQARRFTDLGQSALSNNINNSLNPYHSNNPQAFVESFSKILDLTTNRLSNIQDDMSLYTNPQKLLDSLNPYKQLMDSLPFIESEKEETPFEKFNRIKQLRIKTNKFKYYQLFSKILGYEYSENEDSTLKKNWLIYLQNNLEEIKTFFDDDGKILRDFYRVSDQIDLVEKCIVDKKWILEALRKESIQ